MSSSLEKYNQHQKHKDSKENFTISESSINAGVNDAFYVFLVMIAIMFVLLELFLLFVAIKIALTCTKNTEERLVYFGLAVFFTLPYVLLSVFMSPCAKKALGSEK